MVKKKSARKSGAKKKPRYACRVCGLSVTVDSGCGCVDTCDIVCCGEQMVAKK